MERENYFVEGKQIWESHSKQRVDAFASAELWPQSKFLPLSQSHVDIALYLWNEDGYDSLPPLLLR